VQFGSILYVANGISQQLPKISPKIQEWELFGVATINMPLYRKKGLIEKCIEPLRDELMTRYTRKPVIWAQAIEEINGNYWCKKGYVPIDEGVLIPKGVWSHSVDFTIISMTRLDQYLN
jgi:hypothetical protein